MLSDALSDLDLRSCPVELVERVKKIDTSLSSRRAMLRIDPDLQPTPADSNWAAESADVLSEARSRCRRDDDVVYRSAPPRSAPRASSMPSPRSAPSVHAAIPPAPAPVDDVFSARLAKLDDARGGYGRHAYLVAKTAPRSNDANDLTAQAIQALLDQAPAPPGDLQPPDLARYGIVYVPAASAANASSRNWKVWVDGYGLGLANSIRNLACATACNGAGPFIVVTTTPLAAGAVPTVDVFDLSDASPPMVAHFIRRFRALLTEGRSWKDNPDLLLIVRNELARVGNAIDHTADWVLSIVGRVGRLRNIAAVVAPPAAASGQGNH